MSENETTLEGTATENPTVQYRGKGTVVYWKDGHWVKVDIGEKKFGEQT